MRIIRTIFLLLFIYCSSNAVGWNLSKTKESATPKKISTIEEKPFVIVISANNNEKYIEKNLASVFSQNYENYRVFYVDDHSSDASFQKAKQLTKLFGEEKRTTFIQTSENRGLLANIYNAIHTCQDHEIIIPIDGNSFLAHENVLATINYTYADPEVWITYGNYLDYPSFKPAACKPISEKVIKNNSYRKEAWAPVHLRTFYASLFKEISLEDFIDHGQFYPILADEAITVALFELGGQHSRFIEDYLYLFNRNTKDQEVNILLKDECSLSIRSKSPYSCLQKLPKHIQTEKNTADLVIFSTDHPMHLYALLESCQRFVKGVNKISILYQATTIDYDHAYDDLKRSFPKVHFIKQVNPPNDFKQYCLDLINEAIFPSSAYVLFVADRMIFKDFIDLSTCIYALEATKSYGFFLSQSEILDKCATLNCEQGIPVHLTLTGIPCEDTLLAWQFSQGNHDWAIPNHFHGVLYRKADVKKDYQKINFNDPKSLKEAWNTQASMSAMGLFFSHSKCVRIGQLSEIKWKISPQDLLEKFSAGFKIDIVKFLQTQNHSIEIDKPLSFVPRN